METKILKTSLSIAQKVIGIEVGENSSDIAKQTIANLMLKLQTASRVAIHLNPKDYVVLKDQLTFGETVTLQEDPNVTAGGVVIASDLGNFDGNIEAKVQTMLDSLDMVIYYYLSYQLKNQKYLKKPFNYYTKLYFLCYNDPKFKNFGLKAFKNGNYY
jgi:hypothetical protein